MTQPKPFAGHPGAWVDQAKCLHADTEMWFPLPGQAEVAFSALSLCRQCPVLMACREYAVQTRQTDGVWGGTTETDRKRLRRGRPVPECPACLMPLRSGGCRWCAGVCLECGGVRDSEHDLCRACRGVSSVKQSRSCRHGGCLAHSRWGGLCGTHARRAS